MCRHSVVTLNPSIRNLHVAGGFSRDCIVYADGTYTVAQLGGNALWAALGAGVLGTRTVAHSVLGEGYPEDAITRIQARGVDMSAVRRAPHLLGIRVTYTYEADGTRRIPATPEALALLPEDVRRSFIDTTRLPHEALGAVPTAAELPADNADTAWHLGLMPVERFTELVTHLAPTAAYLQADCPARFQLRDEGLDALAAVLPLLDVFLPSTSDAAVFAPDLDPIELVEAFHDLGARTVVLKCAEDGAIVSTDGGRRRRLVPVFPVTDVRAATGAGDVFAGAFAAAVCAGEDYVHAAVAGAAAASFAVGVTSPLDLPADPPALAVRRSHIDERVTEL